MLPMTIYVSNLSFTMTDDQLKKVFVPFGEVSSARIMTDKFTNRSRGFAFIEMPDEMEAQKAITDLNGSPCDGRNMVVNMAKPRQQP
jgi:RNA recognition motif-containing protein